MKEKKLKEFLEEINCWLNFNKNRGTLHLFDLSKLIAIFSRYYILKLKSEMKTNKEKAK